MNQCKTQQNRDLTENPSCLAMLSIERSRGFHDCPSHVKWLAFQFLSFQFDSRSSCLLFVTFNCRSILNRQILREADGNIVNVEIQRTERGSPFSWLQTPFHCHGFLFLRVFILRENLGTRLLKTCDPRPSES